jgi:adenylate cyclase
LKTSTSRKPERILIVDDTSMNIDLLEGILTPAGYIVDSAESGEAALDKVVHIAPDLVLLDVMMPKMNGYEVCRRIRENKALPYIPIIYITASEIEQKDIIEGLDAGGDDYIRKPFDRAELLARIISSLRVKALYEELARTKAELSRYVSLSTLKMVESKVAGHVEPLDYDTHLTVLFSDIRGFTRISADMDPKEVFNNLNANIEKQLSVIENYQGIISKLSGDEIMAIFEGPQMGENALKCALEIVHELSESESRGELLLPYVGIGINTGPVYLGSLGTQSFRDYTAIGNTVNIAAHLCGLAGRFQILFTKTTRETVDQGAFQFKSFGERMLKGLDKPLQVFQMIP